MAKAFAAAKLNLILHVTGQRSDGYHLLDSYVAMADIGDRITVSPADELSLNCTGPFAPDISSGPDNLVMRAAHLFDISKGAHIQLEKNLPASSGIGGGSSDAAATIRALSQLWSQPVPALSKLLQLGADIPVCMSSQLTRMRGIGDQLEMLGPPPQFPIILVNPRQGVSTPAVFNALASKQNPPVLEAMPDPRNREAWLLWLSKQRNDLEVPAQNLVPVIRDVLAALRAAPGVALARMSGSGATCFALMQNDAARDALAAKLRQTHPDWWIASTRICLETFR